MLSESTIWNLKKASRYFNPQSWREYLEDRLNEEALNIIISNYEDGEDIGTATVREMREQNEAK